MREPGFNTFQCIFSGNRAENRGDLRRLSFSNVKHPTCAVSVTCSYPCDLYVCVSVCTYVTMYVGR